MNKSKLGDYAQESVDVKPQIYRHNLLGFRKAPSISQPLHIRTQEDQKRTMECVFWATCEAIESYVYANSSDGYWWSIPRDETQRLIEIARKNGTYDPSRGAYMDACLEVLKTNPVTMEDGMGGTKEIRVKDFWICAKRNQSMDEYINSIKLAIFKGGIVWGFNTTRGNIGYYEAKKDGIIKDNKDPIPFGHATACTAYDEDWLYLPGSWGEKVADYGVFMLDPVLSKRMFSPLAFSLI